MTDGRALTHSLGGKWHGSYGVAPCPVCQPEGRRDQNALTLSDRSGGGLLAHCKKAGCSFRDILLAAGVTPGTVATPDPLDFARHRAEERAEAERKAAQALRLWQDSQPIGGTIAETYLRGRSITCPLPDSLRFHPGCWHGAIAKRLPAMVAIVEGAERFAVHRTYLRPDGSGKAGVTPDKAMLGGVMGGAVRLSREPGRLVVAEGIETALSLLCGLLDRPVTPWAALSSGGMKGLYLPHEPARLTIAPDSDDKGASARDAHSLAMRANALGWNVSLFPAPEGKDWNDILTEKVTA